MATKKKTRYSEQSNTLHIHTLMIEGYSQIVNKYNYENPLDY